MSEPIPEVHTHTHGNSSLERDLKRIPPWGWGLIAGGFALVGLWWYHSHNSATAAVAATGTDTSTGSDLEDGVLGSDSGGSAANDNTATDTAAAQFTTNGGWEAAGVTYLTGQGNTPLAAEQALEDYLNGNPLTSAEQALVNTVLGKYGLPPEGIASEVNIGGTGSTDTGGTGETDDGPTPFDPDPSKIPTPIGATPPTNTQPPAAKGKIGTLTSVSVSPNSGKIGSQVTVTATVTDASTGSGTPQGSLTLTFGAQSHTVTAPEGSAKFDVGTPTNGKSHAVKATYAGNAAHGGSTSPTVTFTVTK